MKRLGLVPVLAVPALVLGALAPATAAETVRVTGTVTVAGQPVAGATIAMQGMQVTTGSDGRWAADLLSGATHLTLSVDTPHGQAPTEAIYKGSFQASAGLDVPMALPGDRATTLTVTEADGTTPVVGAEWDLFPPPGTKLVPTLGVLDTMVLQNRGADGGVTDEAGRVTFYVPDVVTSDQQTALIEVWDPHYSRPGISQQVAFPAAPSAVTLRFPRAGVPSAVRDLRAEVVAEDSLALAWEAPSSDGGSFVTGYVVTYGGTGEGTRSVDVEPSPTPETTRVRLAGLTPGKRYDVAVVARNAVGSSPAATLQATTQRVPTLPRLTSWSPTSPVSGQQVTLAGRVDSTWSAYPVTGGIVTVYDNGVGIGQVPVSPNGTFSLSRSFLAGGHAIALSYSGDAQHLPAVPSSPTPAPSTFTVAKASSKVVATTAVSGKGNVRDVRLDVVASTVAPGSGTPTGTVTVTAGGTSRTATLAGGGASVTFANLKAKQTVTFTITYAGGPQHQGSSTTVSVRL